jgi:hypothetical protein
MIMHGGRHFGDDFACDRLGRFAGEWFMGLAAVHPLVGLAVRAEISFDTPHKPVCQAALCSAGVPADFALQAAFSHFSVPFGDCCVAHGAILGGRIIVPLYSVNIMNGILNKKIDTFLILVD